MTTTENQNGETGDKSNPQNADIDQYKNRCLTCGKPIPSVSGSGRPRKYCSDSCRYKAYKQALKKRAAEGDTARPNIEELRKSMDEQEQYIMWQRDRIDRLKSESNDYLGYLRKISNDLAALLEAGIVSVDKTAADPRLLARHASIIPIMETFEDRKTSPMQQQEQRYKAMQERHRKELDQAAKEGRNELYLNSIFRRQAKETKQLGKECSAWLAWRDLQEKRKDLRDEHGIDYLPYPAENRMDTVGEPVRKDNDNDTGRQEDSRPRSTAQESESREGANQQLEKETRQDQRYDQESLRGIPDGIRRNTQDIRLETGHSNQTRHQTSGDHDADDQQTRQDGTGTHVISGHGRTDAGTGTDSECQQPSDGLLTNQDGGELR